jgi:hypothetical protein
LGLKITLFRLRGKKKINSTPFASGKCSSLTAKPMMLNFGESLLDALLGPGVNPLEGSPK